MTIVTPVKAGVQAVRTDHLKETWHPGYRLVFTPVKTGAGMKPCTRKEPLDTLK
jgi:hypothetical protein